MLVAAVVEAVTCMSCETLFPISPPGTPRLLVEHRLHFTSQPNKALAAETGSLLLPLSYCSCLPASPPLGTQRMSVKLNIFRVPICRIFLPPLRFYQTILTQLQ